MNKIIEAPRYNVVVIETRSQTHQGRGYADPSETGTEIPPTFHDGVPPQSLSDGHFQANQWNALQD